jgi:hypothetical protein
MSMAHITRLRVIEISKIRFHYNLFMEKQKAYVELTSLEMTG